MGLSQELRELVEREGLDAALEFLRNVRIRFDDGCKGSGRAPRFAIKVRDPERGGEPNWWQDEGIRTSWREALIQFASDHERLKLRRHAQRGNVNGVENFVNIFATVVGILFEYNHKGVLVDESLINWTLKYVRVACQGEESSDSSTSGFLATAVENLDGNTEDLVEQANKFALAAHLRAALLLAQKVRWTERDAAQYPVPRTCHPRVLSDLQKSLRDAGIPWPSPEQTIAAIATYSVLTEEELSQWQFLLSDDG